MRKIVANQTPGHQPKRQVIKANAMQLNQKPVHRRIIVPWHDSLTSCLITIFIMLMVFLMSIAGVFVAMENPSYQRHVWVPAIFVLSSGWVIVSIIIRVISRYAVARQNSSHGFNPLHFQNQDFQNPCSHIQDSWSPDKKTGGSSQ